MFTVIPYLYRDAANYKQHGEIVLEGQLNASELAAVKEKLSDGIYFIPGDLAGLDIEELQPQATGFPSEDDHVFHELRLDDIYVRDTVPEGTSVLDSKDFVKAFEGISHSEGWDIAACMLRLDIPV